MICPFNNNLEKTLHDDVFAPPTYEVLFIPKV